MSTVRLQFSVDLRYEVLPGGADFVFKFQAARTAQQRLLNEQLHKNPGDLHNGVSQDTVTATRVLRLRAMPGPFHLSYSAIVDVAHYRVATAQLAEVPVSQLPASVLLLAILTTC